VGVWSSRERARVFLTRALSAFHAGRLERIGNGRELAWPEDGTKTFHSPEASTTRAPREFNPKTGEVRLFFRYGGSQFHRTISVPPDKIDGLGNLQPASGNLLEAVLRRAFLASTRRGGGTEHARPECGRAVANASTAGGQACISRETGTIDVRRDMPLLAGRLRAMTNATAILSVLSMGIEVISALNEDSSASRERAESHTARIEEILRTERRSRVHSPRRCRAGPRTPLFPRPDVAEVRGGLAPAVDSRLSRPRAAALIGRPERTSCRSIDEKHRRGKMKIDKPRDVVQIVSFVPARRSTGSPPAPSARDPRSPRPRPSSIETPSDS